MFISLLRAIDVYIRHGIRHVNKIIKIMAFRDHIGLNGYDFRIQRSILHNYRLFVVNRRRSDFVETSLRNLEILFFHRKFHVFSKMHDTQMDKKNTCLQKVLPCGESNPGRGGENAES